MKIKVIKKIVILCCMLVAFMLKPSISIFADELDVPVEIEVDSPYLYVGTASCMLSISSGTATVSYNIYGNSTTAYTSASLYLEKFVNGSWQPYYSWAHNGGTDLYGSDSTSVLPGLYRVWMSVTAYGAGGGVESFNVDGNMSGY